MAEKPEKKVVYYDDAIFTIFKYAIWGRTFELLIKRRFSGYFYHLS